MSTPEHTPSLKPVPSSDVARLQAWQDAERVCPPIRPGNADRQRGFDVAHLWGSHGAGVGPVAYAKLKAGMQSGYVNRHGRRGVHVLVAP